MAELPLQELHDRRLLLGFVLESINKLEHASSVSNNYCWKSSFPVADMLYGLHGSVALGCHTIPAAWSAGALLAYIKQ